MTNSIANLLKVDYIILSIDNNFHLIHHFAIQGIILWLSCSQAHLINSFFIQIPNFLRAPIFFNSSDLEPRIIFKYQDAALPKNLINMFQSLFYYIIKLSKSLYFVLLVHKEI